jgi:protein-disulfide isomerase
MLAVAELSGESALIGRRQLLRGTGIALAGMAAIGNCALGLTGSAWAEETATPDDVMKPGPLPEKMLGSSTAPVVFLEYASMTCSHCAIFANVTFPALKADYVDSGKVRYVFREFPIDGLAAAAAMLARSTGDDNFFAAIEALFASQREWVADRVQPLMTFAAKQFGLTPSRFTEIMADQQLFEKIKQTRDRGEKLGVSSTPTFFINGKKWKGNLSKGALDKTIAPLLKT